MRLVKRTIESLLLEDLLPNKVVVLIGPRRVGKTVLLGQVIDQMAEPYLLLNGEDIVTRDLLARRSISHYRNILGDTRLLFIDEAQKLPEVGQVLKLMIDHVPGLRILATGSSAFDINNQMGEPLTGRKTTHHLFAFSERELDQVETILEKKDNLQQRLIYGNYPELLRFTNNGQKEAYLRELVGAYLLKDILVFEQLKKADKIFDLLKLIAYQIGQEVSVQELGNQLGMSRNTVERYLDLLAKVFVIHQVRGYSRNLRKEVTKSSRWYFFDNGLRNAIIANFSPIMGRNDIGMLWENYVISERIKFQHYSRMSVNNYFWRTYDQQEIDWVEERGGQLHGFEIKWNPRKQTRPPIAWSKAYPNATFQVINPDNFQEWVKP